MSKDLVVGSSWWKSRQTGSFMPHRSQARRVFSSLSQIRRCLRTTLLRQVLHRRRPHAMSEGL